MPGTRIVLAGLWVALMLIYLLGDVLRIFAGDFKPGEIFGRRPTQAMWLGIAALMLVPILMVMLTRTLPDPAIRWTTIVVAAIVFVFNVFGLPYPGAYDNFLIIVSLGVNALTIWYAWRWVG
jgi:hypothetical protein